MRIEASQVSYVTTHLSANATAVIDETLFRPRTFARQSGAPSPQGVQPVAGDTVQLSELAGFGKGDLEELKDLSPKVRLALRAVEALLGHKIRLFHFPSRVPSRAGDSSATAGASAARAQEVHRRTEFHSEVERTSFQAQGAVETADGRSIQISVDLTMQRAFRSYSASTVSPKTSDPLVVNFGGAPAQLTGAKIAFDLNSDGKPENISFVAGGSGFLVLDSNGDGKVNDGGEMFGPQSGNGFGELAAYDADHNGWIDENDPIFAKLRIWSQDGLSTLLEKGVGAIAISSAETPFAIKDGANDLQGNVISSGVYLSESGVAGTIQQVDLAVS